jgi:hypothetical protein
VSYIRNNPLVLKENPNTEKKFLLYGMRVSSTDNTLRNIPKAIDPLDIKWNIRIELYGYQFSTTGLVKKRKFYFSDHTGHGSEKNEIWISGKLL